MHKVFITGTDTGVGKTFISSLLVKKFNAYYFKPIQTGSREELDSKTVQYLTGLEDKYFLSATYLFKEPVSPHLAAKIENREIDIKDIYCPNETPLIVEGAGGVFVPLNKKFFMLDLMKHLDLPILVVARSTLGTINHTLLTIKALKRKNLDVLGVILNGPLNQENKIAIEYYGKVKVLAEIPWLEVITPSVLDSLVNEIDIDL
ncbi:dethiobiotin synthetase [Desulfonauticus submarinus]|uniref:ATP-dependent dethiobiotin synthetase BioD n=1 Tax=Desulfonauticus submarinus TaxID=206665 RepID=A0A1H0DLR7_9BACT|nr:dethiobiotin synthase [Desulfonauticus submarinus]SDN71018.1 dethiobiotin synthetase [Desulfonauticus submarinus]